MCEASVGASPHLSPTDKGFSKGWPSDPCMRLPGSLSSLARRQEAVLSAINSVGNLLEEHRKRARRSSARTAGGLSLGRQLAEKQARILERIAKLEAEVPAWGGGATWQGAGAGAGEDGRAAKKHGHDLDPAAGAGGGGGGADELLALKRARTNHTVDGELAGGGVLPAGGAPNIAGPRPVPVTQQRLEAILGASGDATFRFARVPPNYYSLSLEQRRDLLGAASVEHLCKSIVLVNTQADPSIVDCRDPNNSKYYVVIVQYAAKLSAEKVRTFVHSLNDGYVPKKRFNMRLAPEAVATELTGYEHNAVTPISMKTKIPVLISEAILRLQPDFFWLGGGEVDLKLGIKTSAFLEIVKPFVCDCTV